MKNLEMSNIFLNNNEIEEINCFLNSNVKDIILELENNLIQNVNSFFINIS